MTNSATFMHIRRAFACTGALATALAVTVTGVGWASSAQAMSTTPSASPSSNLRPDGSASETGSASPNSRASQQGAPKSARILYFQDAHEFQPVTWDDGSLNGGIAYLATVLKQAKQDRPDAIAAFGGEVAGGTLFGAVYKGEPFVEAYNDLGVDVAGFGQHDFDQGSQWTSTLIDRAEYPWISSNLTHLDGSPFSPDGTTYVQESGGVKVGFLSLTSEMDTTAGGSSVVQKDLVESARAAAAQLEAAGVDATVAITQISPDDAVDVLNAVPDIDAAFTEENGRQITEARTDDGRLVVSGQPDFASIIAADVTVGEGGQVSVAYEPLPVNPSVPADPEYAAIASEYETKLDEQLSAPVGEASADLNTEELGFQVARAYREHYGTDFGWQNAGGIRAEVVAGEVTRRDILSVLPFGMWSLPLRPPARN